MKLEEKYKNVITNDQFKLLNDFGKPTLDDMIKLSLDNNININIIIDFFIDKYKDEIIKNINS